MKSDLYHSQKAMDKFIGDTMIDISGRGYLSTIYYYIIDSKERTRVKVKNFLHNQLAKPDYQVFNLAMDFAKKYPDYDERIIAILHWVWANITYLSDNKNFKKVEYWATARETLDKRLGDCDDINSLIYVLARLSGIQNAQIWAMIGDTEVGGHFWLTYFSLKTDKWYYIDGTFYPNFKKISKGRPEFVFNKHKYQNIWCMFNDKFSYRGR